MRQISQRRAALIAAILKEVEDKLAPAKGGARYSHAMVRQGKNDWQKRHLRARQGRPVHTIHDDHVTHVGIDQREMILKNASPSAVLEAKTVASNAAGS